MRRIILNGICMLVISAGITQQIQAQLEMGQLDSLKQVIANQSDQPEKIDNILILAREYTYIDKDDAMMFAKQALALSEQLEYNKGKLDALYRMGLVHKKLGNYNESFSLYKELLSLSEELQDSVNMADGYFQYGILYRLQGKENSAIYFHQKSLALYYALNNPGGLISNYNSIGNIFQNIGEYDSAAFYFMTAINLCRETNGKEKNLATIYLNLGEVFQNLGDYKNAKEYLNMALAYYTLTKNDNARALAYTKLGNVANEEMQLDSALNYYSMAKSIYTRENNLRGINDHYVNSGIVFMKKGLYKPAYSNFSLALAYYIRQNLPEGIIAAWQNMASVLTSQKRYAEALILLDSCYNLSYRTGLKKERLDMLKQISDLYYESGDFRQSIDYSTKYNALKDSIFKLDKEEIVADLRIRYERELDQAKILALENENLRKTKQRNTYLFTGLGIITLILFLFIFFRYKARKDKIISTQRIRQLEEEKKLLAARFLVEGEEKERKRIAKELHDGLGVLLSVTKMQFSAIKDASPENKPLIEKASQFLEQASGDVRKISHNMMPGLLTKLGLCEALEDLFEKLTDTEGIQAICYIEGPRERLPENKEIMLYRIIQEMVNNTLKHAEAGKIELRVNVSPGHLDIRFADNGKGFEVAEGIEKKSIGLQSIWSRVNFLDGNISVESSPGKGTVYTIKIPV